MNRETRDWFDSHIIQIYWNGKHWWEFKLGIHRIGFHSNQLTIKVRNPLFFDLADYELADVYWRYREGREIRSREWHLFGGKIIRKNKLLGEAK